MHGIKLYRDLWIDYRTRYSRYILPFISYYLFSIDLFISAITTQWNWSLAKANCPNTNCAHARITTVEIEILLTPASTIIWIAFTLIYASDGVTIVDGLSFLHFLCYTLYFLYPEIKFEIPTWNFDIFRLLNRSSVYACTRFLLLYKLLFRDMEIRCSYFPLHFLRFYKYFRRQCNENSHLALADFHKNIPSSETNPIDSIFLDYFCHPSNPSFRTIWKDLCDSIVE